MSLVLAALPAVALSQPPFALNGLHVDLKFNDAVARAEALGGRCAAVRPNRLQQTGVTVQCAYEACTEDLSAGECDPADLAAAPRVAAQAIVSVGLEAPDEGSALTRIVILYEGDTEVIATSFLSEFGPTDVDGAPPDNNSWSHARRWNWTRGQYRVGLLNAPQMIVLAVDRSLAAPVEETADVAVP